MRAFSIHAHEYQHQASWDIFGSTSKVDEDTYHGPPDGLFRLSCSITDRSDHHGLAICGERYYSLLALSVVGSYYSKDHTCHFGESKLDHGALRDGLHPTLKSYNSHFHPATELAEEEAL